MLEVKEEGCRVSNFALWFLNHHFTFHPSGLLPILSLWFAKHLLFRQINSDRFFWEYLNYNNSNIFCEIWKINMTGVTTPVQPINFKSFENVSHENTYNLTSGKREQFKPSTYNESTFNCIVVDACCPKSKCCQDSAPSK